MESQHVLLAWAGTTLTIGLLWQIAQMLPPPGSKVEKLSLSNLCAAIHKFYHPPAQRTSLASKVKDAGIRIDNKSIAWDCDRHEWRATVLPDSYFGGPCVVWTSECKYDEETGEEISLDEKIYSFEHPWDTPKHCKAAADAIKRYNAENALSWLTSFLLRHTTQNIGYGYSWRDSYTWATCQLAHVRVDHLVSILTHVAVSSTLLMYACPQFGARNLMTLLVTSMLGTGLAFHMDPFRRIQIKGASGIWYGLVAATATLIFGTAETKEAQLLGAALLLQLAYDIADDVIGILKCEDDGTEHAGHVGGALSGLVYAIVWLWLCA